MDLPDQAKRQRKRRESIETVIHGSDVVDHVLDIVWDVFRPGIQLECEDILEGALRPFDLGTVDRFASNIHGNEEVRIGQRVGYAVQPSDCLIRCGEKMDDCVIHPDRGIEWERSRNKRSESTRLSDVPTVTR